MNIIQSKAKSKSIRTYVLVAVAAISITTACGTGVAAFAGLLPASNGVAETITAMPLIDVQVDTSAYPRVMNFVRRVPQREAA